MLAFHAELGPAGGGFLGVSVFFTLSGFLITTLLLREHQDEHRIDLGHFYARRARRLVPAAYASIAAVLALGSFWTVGQRRALPGDAVATVANVVNWRFAFAGQSYQDLFVSTPSPLAHFWSLAIEEQCYLLLPLVAWWALRQGGVRRLGTTLGLLLLASVAATVLTSDVDLVYNGTHTRAAELLMGALAAVLVLHHRPSKRVLGVLAVGGLAALVVLVGTVDLQDEWLYRGGFVGVAVVSALTVVGLLGDGAAARVLGTRPAVALGRRSYGVYLYHWPIFLVLTEARTGLSQWPLLAVRLALTAAVAVISYRWLESPVRSGRVLRRPRVSLMALGASATALVLAAALFVPSASLTRTEVILAAAARPTVPVTPVTPVTTVTPVTPGTTEPDTAPPPTRWLVIGDSSSLLVATALQDAAGPDLVVQWAGQEGCPFVPALATSASEDVGWRNLDCIDVAHQLDLDIGWFQPDAVLLVVGAMELMAQRYESDPVDSPGHLPGSAEYVAVHDRGIESLLSVVRRHGVPLVVADTPPLGVGSFSTFEMADPARADAFNAEVARWHSEHPDLLVLDYADPLLRYEAEHGLIRLDGSHPEIGALTEIARSSLVPSLQRLVRERT